MKAKLIALWGNDLLRGSSILFIGTMFVNAMAFGNHLIMARLMGPAEYGVLAAVLGLTYLLSIPVTALDIFTTKIVASFKHHNSLSHSHGLIRFLLGSTTKIFLVLTAVLFFTAPRVAGFLNISSTSSVYLVWLFMYMSCLVVVTRAVFKGLLKFVAPMLNLSLDMFVRVLLSTVFLLFIAPTHELALTGFILATGVGLVVCIYQLKFVFNVSPSSFSHHHLPFASVGGGSLLIAACYSAMFSLDILLVKHFLPAVDAGIYGVLVTAGKIIFFAASPLGAALLPAISKESDPKIVKQHLITTIFLISLVGLGVVLLYFLFPNPIINLIFTSKFSSAAAYLPWMGIAIFLYSLSSVLSAFLLASNNFAGGLLPAIAVVSEIIGLSLFHTNLSQIIIVLTCVFAILAMSLLLYSLYVTQSKKIQTSQASISSSPSLSPGTYHRRRSQKN